MVANLEHEGCLYKLDEEYTLIQMFTHIHIYA